MKTPACIPALHRRLIRIGIGDPQIRRQAVKAMTENPHCVLLAHFRFCSQQPCPGHMDIGLWTDNTPFRLAYETLCRLPQPKS